MNCLKAGMKDAECAREVGCSKTTVRNVRKKSRLRQRNYLCVSCRLLFNSRLWLVDMRLDILKRCLKQKKFSKI